MKRLLILIETHGSVDLGNIEATMAEAERVETKMVRVENGTATDALMAQFEAASRIVAQPSSLLSQAGKRSPRGKSGMKAGSSSHKTRKAEWESEGFVTEEVKGSSGARFYRVNVLESARRLGFKSIDELISSNPKRGSKEFRLRASYRQQKSAREREERLNAIQKHRTKKPVEAEVAA